MRSLSGRRACQLKESPPNPVSPLFTSLIVYRFYIVNLYLSPSTSYSSNYTNPTDYKCKQLPSLLVNSSFPQTDETAPPLPLPFPLFFFLQYSFLYDMLLTEASPIIFLLLRSLPADITPPPFSQSRRASPPPPTFPSSVNTTRLQNPPLFFFFSSFSLFNCFPTRYRVLPVPNFEYYDFVFYTECL